MLTFQTRSTTHGCVTRASFLPRLDGVPQVSGDLVVAVAADVSDMPDPAEVEELYAAAAAPPPFSEPREVAKVYATCTSKPEACPIRSLSPHGA